ncbi:2-amino-4-hydroxy-6-hydroxymethyldihydropteridine diphosphokinase [Desulfovibrio mangrovi]|nr:2-amino-4-hydroxy-6-hydroxymethyldihydropteridine diphosphokinase [Desulfovibrio mangrovi]UZP69127.1 2-amino-4-hydroxy-6-hydroxymethyldihydropteridine diphosphokinase [Desulfovibrio mangrovi]
MCLGSNMGDTDGNLARAVEAISALEGVSLEAASGVYRTEPQEKKDQAWFANQVIRVSCDARTSPETLLASLLNIESSMGRCRDGSAPEDRFGPRIIDLDLLLFGSSVMATETLVLPHPRMQQRAFVLIPLHEIAPELTFPDGKTLLQALNALQFRLVGDQIWQ